MPGLCSAPALFFGIMALAVTPVPVLAQEQAPAALSVQPPPSIRPTPGPLELSKMIWSTIAAVDHANRSGNYSVLRDISAQGFQINNNAAQLAQIFAGLREIQVDLSNALVVPPSYSVAPQVIREDVFRVQGVFQLRPVSIAFDIYYQWEQGAWKLVGIELRPLEMVSAVPTK